MKVKNLNSYIEHIVSGYKQQYQCYRQLLELSQQLTDLVSENALDMVQEVLLKQEDVIKNIKELDQNISQHKEAVMNLLHLKEYKLDKVQDLIHVNLRKELDGQRAAIEQIIKVIIETDRKNEEVLKNLKHDVVKELKSIKQHYNLQQTYFDRPEKFPEPRFFDKKK